MKTVIRTILLSAILSVSASAYAVEAPAGRANQVQLQDKYMHHLTAKHIVGNITVLAATPLEAENTMRLFRDELSRVRREILHDESLELTLPITVCVWDTDEQYRAQVTAAQDHGNACSFQADTKTSRRHEIHLSPNQVEGLTHDEAILNMLPHEICHILQQEQFLKDKLNKAQTAPAKQVKTKTAPRNYPLAVAEGLSVLSEHSSQDARIRLTAEAFATAAVNPIASRSRISRG